METAGGGSSADRSPRCLMLQALPIPRSPASCDREFHDIFMVFLYLYLSLHHVYDLVRYSIIQTIAYTGGFLYRPTKLNSLVHKVSINSS